MSVQSQPDTRWLDWVRELQAIAQTGLAYDKDPYDSERYRRILDLAAEIAAAYTGADFAMIRNLFAQDTGHATPKVDVRGVIFENDQILLVKESRDGRWTLPGGWVDIGEAPSEACVRETYEESGYKTQAVKLLAVYDRARHGHPPHLWHIYKLFFRCESVGASEPLPPNTETEAVAFFAEDALPELSIGRVTPAQIKRLFEHYRNPDLPTDFD
ncbi:MAG: NUDIX hydrolase [Chloroflexi bacterium]|nr:NUDIX hydrolase [Chloroflexota bacterium]